MHVRTLFAVALAALLVGPATVHAQAKKSTAPAKPAAAAPAPATSPAAKLSMGGWIGYEMGDLDGLQLRVDGIMPFQKLSPQVDLSLVGSIGYSYLTHSESAFGYDVDTTAHVLKLVPAARFTFPVNPQLSFFGDAGLGLYYASWSVDTNVPLSVDYDDSAFGFMFRFGLGGLYAVNPKTQVGASIMLDPMLGDYDDTTFTILAGLTYRL